MLAESVRLFSPVPGALAEYDRKKVGSIASASANVRSATVAGGVVHQLTDKFKAEDKAELGSSVDNMVQWLETLQESAEEIEAIVNSTSSGFSGFLGSGCCAYY